MFKHFASSVGKRIRSNRTRLFLAAGTAILAAVAFTLASVAANDAILPRSNRVQASRPASTPAQANKTYTLYSGLWRTDGSFVSTIRIKNVLVVAPMDVTPVLFMADGTPYMLASVHVAVSGVATVNINDALAAAPPATASHTSQFGSAALIYSYPSPGHVTASMAVIDASRSLSYTSPFLEPRGDAMQQTLEGLWWKHDPGVSGWIALSNVTEADTQASVQLVAHGDEGDEPQAAHTISLSAHTTQMFHLEDFASNPSPSKSGGIRVQYIGQPGSVLVTGGLENGAEGYSANIPFWAHDMSSAPVTGITYATVGLMVGKPDPMMMPGFPKETTFSPYLVLRNTTEKPLDVSLQLNYMMSMEGNAPVTRNLRAKHLAPFETRQVDIQAALSSVSLKNFNGSINLSTSFVGKAGDLVLASGSVDQSGTYVFEVGAQGVGRSQSKFANYWGVTNGNDTMFSLWNPTEAAQDIAVTFYYGDGSGQYVLPVHLEAQASTMIDMAMLIAEIKPDADGNVIPPGIQEGSAVFASAKDTKENITLVIDGGLYNVSSATCGCTYITCCGYNQFGISPNPIYCVIGETMPCSTQMTDCYGNVGSIGPGTWSSSNTSVMTVDGSGNVTGVSVGSATIQFSSSNYFVNYTGTFCSPQPSCPQGAPTVQAPANVTPTVSGPNTVWYFGNLTVSGYTTSAHLTANGGDSSTTWNITAGSDKITVSSFTGSSISVLSSGTAFSSSVGDVTLTATANGQTSAPFLITTRTPNLSVLGTIITACDQDYGYKTTVNYTVKDQLGSTLPSHMPVNENWTTGVVPDYNGTNWRRGDPNGFDEPGSAFADAIQGEDASHTPLATCDGNSTAVEHWGQEWRVGSIATGFGSRIQTDTIQKYIGRATHTSIVSPAP